MTRLEDEIQQRTFRSNRQRLLVNILFTSNWLNAIQSRMLKEHGISPQQYNILRILRGQHPDPATINLLRERMLDKMSNASRLVEKLRQKGLVERRVCKSDRRAVDVLITDAGLHLLDQLTPMEREWEALLAHLDEGEASTLNVLLDKMRG